MNKYGSLPQGFSCHSTRDISSHRSRSKKIPVSIIPAQPLRLCALCHNLPHAVFIHTEWEPMKWKAEKEHHSWLQFAFNLFLLCRGFQARGPVSCQVSNSFPHTHKATCRRSFAAAGSCCVVAADKTTVHLVKDEPHRAALRWVGTLGFCTNWSPPGSCPYRERESQWFTKYCTCMTATQI